MGIGRFAFTPLLPLMVRDGALAQSAGAWLAASNYLGYLAGALTASRLGLSLPALMRLSLAGTVVATAAMGAVDGLAAWACLRFLRGRVQRLDAGCDQCVGPATPGAGGTRGSLRHGLRGRRPRHCCAPDCFALWPHAPASSPASFGSNSAAVAALLVVVPDLVLGRPSEVSAPLAPMSPSDTPERCTGLVICYGVLGFGYILPATFLPALAREVVDDPQIFGLAWPVFGIAAALSTVVTARCFGQSNRLRVWAASHF